MPIPTIRYSVAGRCAVAGCDRSRSENGLCSGHGQRWRDRDRPAMAVFLADPGPVLNGRRDLMTCSVIGCRYGSSGSGLCTRHRAAWVRAGQPDPGTWSAQAGLLGPPDPQQCSLPFCTVWTENARNLYCKAHTTRWAQLGRPDNAEYLTHCQQRGIARIDFRGLTAQLKLELQYAVQCRHDQATITAAPPVIAWTIRTAKNAAVTSLLNLSAEQWRELAGSKEGTYQRFLIFARDTVETLRDGIGWDVEYPREIWRLHRLPGLTRSPGKRPHARMHLRFDRLAQPWLRTLAKRWARLRLCSGLSVGTVQNDLLGLTRFSAFLAECRSRGPRAQPTSTAPCSNATWHGWPPSPSAAARRRTRSPPPGSFSRRSANTTGTTVCRPPRCSSPVTFPLVQPRLTRHVAEHIMAQVEAPANLDKWPNPEGRLITIILIRCGLRATDACTLPFDCLLHDGQNAAYLRYFNNKMRREAAVPIDEELESEIRAQQQRVSRPLAGPSPAPVPGRHLQRRRTEPDDLLQLPEHAQLLAGHLRGPRRARPAGASHAAPVASHLRLPSDQPRRPPRGHPGPARSRVDRDDRPLRPHHRSDRPAALAGGDEGQHQR